MNRQPMAGLSAWHTPGRNAGGGIESARRFAKSFRGGPWRTAATCAFAFCLLAIAPAFSIAAPSAREIILERSCYACHVIPGIPEAVGTNGPPLKNFAKRKRIAGGLLTNTPDNLRIWLKNPKAVKTTFMPNPGLTEEEIEILLKFLYSL